MTLPKYSRCEYPCECPEAVTFRRIVEGELPLPDTAAWTVVGWFVEALALRKLAAVRAYAEAAGAWGPTFGNPYAESHAITSVINCARCGEGVEVRHPLSREQVDALPDTSWVRCARCSTSTVGQSPTALGGVPNKGVS